MVLRALVAAAAAAAVTGAVLMRSWDREAGRRVAELTRARSGDEWRAEERAAELEADLEEAREIRARLETKLRRKRVELAGLRGEHAALLRRYANAETERASVLESRRRLAIEASAPARELPAARSTPTPDAYARAARALADLPRNAALQKARRIADEARQRDLAERARETEERRGKHAAAEPSGPGTGQDRGPSAALPATATATAPAAQAPATRPVPAASAVVPYAAARRHLVPQGSFDFFGTQKAAPAAIERAAIESVQNEDLADVVGEEALAAHRSDASQERAVGKVIDLTAHDETEQLDVAELRSAIS
ncbi:hypothetical protein K388_06155 [Streptomyces sp. KhCrAH-43]|uniref:hypothetical protein n=1 Tax=unclassified Streptomyces TaxID=2593676 RepID=UPI00035CB255|nr:MULTISPECIES: hypothetical protein [unclassified Streptomyces]MYS36523.1 hypothetical protein [Streptomyces sp. SID4920]MYX69930.1 hypothetical protein [Streptomyces sp. SID8373]RAJ52381.1 hypothetical protein K388_06155 [Streptomyces sp. KhCrAH-43]